MPHLTTPTRILATCATLVCLAAGPALAQDCKPVPRQPATDKLIRLVESNTDVKFDLEQSIALGQDVNSDPMTNPVASLDDYYDFIDALVTYNPQNIRTGVHRGAIRIAMDGKNYCNWNILDLLAYSYFLVDRQLTTDPRGQIQFANDPFSEWMRTVAEEWGAYLERYESSIHVPDFTRDPNFGDWYCPPDGGYGTYQAFFTRELCPATYPNGTRPVAGLNDDRTVVSIGDSTSAGWWPISTGGKLVTTYDGVAQSGRAIKGKLYSDVSEFIHREETETVLEAFGEIDPEIFFGGTWTHQFLNVNNYHRLHVPVAGEIVFLRHIQSGVRMKAGWVEPRGQGEPGYYDPRDTADWQFGQTRMVIGIDTGTEYGTVVISPMGMAQVSGIDKRDWVTLGATTWKGQEFANFKFGGSDFVVIFQPEADFVLTVEHEPDVPPGNGVNYVGSQQGERYGCFGGVDDCDAVRTDPGDDDSMETEMDSAVEIETTTGQ